MTFYSALNFETSVRNFINATKALVGVKCLLSAETLAKVRWACKKNILFYWRDYRAQLLKGRLVLNPDSFSSKTFLRLIFSVFCLRASNHQLVDKMN